MTFAARYAEPKYNTEIQLCIRNDNLVRRDGRPPQCAIKAPAELSSGRTKDSSGRGRRGDAEVAEIVAAAVLLLHVQPIAPDQNILCDIIEDRRDKGLRLEDMGTRVTEIHRERRRFDRELHGMKQREGPAAHAARRTEKVAAFVEQAGAERLMRHVATGVWVAVLISNPDVSDEVVLVRLGGEIIRAHCNSPEIVLVVVSGHIDANVARGTQRVAQFHLHTVGICRGKLHLQLVRPQRVEIGESAGHLQR
jgi:hypothetical protein